MREEMDPTVRAVLATGREIERRRRSGRYQRRVDCLALAVELFRDRRPEDRVPELARAVCDTAQWFERWLMEPFRERDDDDE